MHGKPGVLLIQALIGIAHTEVAWQRLRELIDFFLQSQDIGILCWLVELLEVMYNAADDRR